MPRSAAVTNPVTRLTGNVPEGWLTLEIRLNGTNVNPFHRWGLKQNPFPSLSKRQHSSLSLHIAKLGADPIPNEQYIRDHLAGWDKDFVDFICSKFEPGKMVRFSVSFPADNSPPPNSPEPDQEKQHGIVKPAKKHGAVKPSKKSIK